MNAPLVGIVMGSQSDWEVMKQAAQQLKEFGVPYEARALSAHRTPDLLIEWIEKLEAGGAKCFIAGAGGAAHLAGVVAAWYMYMKNTALPGAIQKRIQPIYTLLDNKYYMDWINENIIARAARLVGTGLWKGGDQAIIDGVLINGSAKAVGGIAALTRLVQTGHLYWYALVMLLGVFGLLTWQLWPTLSGVFGR